MGLIKLSNDEIDLLQKFISSVFEIDILVKSRLPFFIYRRKIIIELLFKRGYSYSDIARILKKDHTTIQHVLKNDFFCKELKDVREVYKNLESQLTDYLETNKIQFKK